MKLKMHPYKFVSSIVYEGNGKSGHYRCLRMYKGELYDISDSTVKRKDFSKVIESQKYHK